MAMKIKIINARDFLEVATEGIINLTTSRQVLVDIDRTDGQPAGYDLLIDFRETQSTLSTPDLQQLAAELSRHGDTFHRKVALLVLPGVDFDRARFFETCSHDRGFSVNAFTDYEKALAWMLPAEDLPIMEGV